MEVILAALLFILLSPGLIFTLPPGPGGLFAGSSTSNIAVIVHAVLFFIAQKLVQQGTFPFNYLTDVTNEISTNHAQVAGGTAAPLLATILFILLSPGLLLTLPPDQGGVFMSQDTNVLAVMIHGLLYFVALKAYTTYLPNSSALRWFNEQLQSV